MDITLSHKSLCGKVCAPPSKSFMHRALICAAASKGETSIKCSKISDDIRATGECLEALGTSVIYNKEEIRVGETKNSEKHVKLDCKESGSTLRFMLPYVASLGKSVTLTGAPRLGKRPLGPLCDSLRTHGVDIRYGESSFLPSEISGKMDCGEYEVNATISSQFISGLIMALANCGGGTVFTKGKIVSGPYIDMTIDVLNRFGVDVKRDGNAFIIPNKPFNAPKEIVAEGDFSNAAFWLVAGAIGGDIVVENIPQKTTQGDKEIINILSKMGASLEINENSVRVKKSKLRGTIIDAESIPDLVPVLSVLACYAEGETVFKNTKRLREKESDRVEAILSMINSLGGNAKADENTITIKNAQLHGGTVDSFNDHRIAMSASVASVISSGDVTIKGAEAVNKSYPDFFEKFHDLEG